MVGARSVVASDRRVRDEDAFAFIQSFYAYAGLERPAEGLQRPMLAARVAGDDIWDAYRLYGGR